ncbi:MAG: glycosyltransferase family 87 protein [Pseudomonadota bacterium]
MATGTIPVQGRSLLLALYGLFLLNGLLTAALLWAVHGPSGSGTMMDFGALWGAAVLALDGQAAAAYDLATLTEVQSEGIGRPYEREMAWRYPPMLQMVLAPLGTLPLLAAQAIWTVLTLAFYVWVVWRILPMPLGVAAALAPATVAMLILSGQVGFLTAALLGLVLLALARPAGSFGGLSLGVPLGLLAIKPTLGLAVPLVLLAQARWGAILWASATVVGAVALSALVLGAEAWIAFIDSIAGAVRDTARVSAFDLHATVSGVFQQAGVFGWPGLAAQVALSGAMAAALLVVAWRRSVAPLALAALTGYATAGITPRIMDYELTVLLIGGLFHARHLTESTRPAARWEVPALAIAMVLPHLDLLAGLPVNWLIAPMLFTALLCAERAAAAASRAG